MVEPGNWGERDGRPIDLKLSGARGFGGWRAGDGVVIEIQKGTSELSAGVLRGDLVPGAALRSAARSRVSLPAGDGMIGSGSRAWVAVASKGEVMGRPSSSTPVRRATERSAWSRRS